MRNKIINLIIGLDFISPLLTLGMLQYLPSSILIGLGIGLIVLRWIDIFWIYRHFANQSQYQISMQQVIIFYHHRRIPSFLIYCLAILVLVLIRILL